MNFTQKECENETKNYYDKTPYVLGNKFTPDKKNFTQPLVVMVETFRMSAKGVTLVL